MGYIQKHPYTGHKANERPSLLDGRITVIHDKLYQRLTEKYSIATIDSFKALRDIASLEDLAFNQQLSKQISSTLDGWLISSLTLKHSYVDPDFQTLLTDSDEVELSNIDHLSNHDNSIISAVSFFLNPDKYKKENNIIDNDNEAIACGYNFKHPTIDKLPYRVVTYRNNIVIVVGEGFLKYLEDNSAKKRFVTDVLKSAYSLYPLNAVNETDWYPLYLKTLQG